MAATDPLKPGLLQFGPFEADVQTEELSKQGVQLRLPRQSFQILAILLQKPGQLITREQLHQALWPSDTFVDFDKGINAAINRLREALGDSAENPRYVETLPRRGYRFIAPVSKPSSPALPARVRKGLFENLKPKTRWLSVGVTLVALVWGIGLWRPSGKRTEGSRPIEVVPLAALPGIEIEPAFSPDGNQVAFVLREEGRQNNGIYTTMIGGERSLRLTSYPDDFSPTWSPDGRQVAFYRDTDHSIDIYVVPALGGTAQRLYTGLSSTWTRGLSWSPDGKALAFSASGAADKNRTSIALLSLADSTTRSLTSPSGQEIDINPAFSPDGSTVAFVRATLAGAVADLYVIPSTGGMPKRLTFDSRWIKGAPTWTPDGRDIVFSSGRGGSIGLWRVSASGGAPRPVEGVGATAFHPSVSPKGDQLVYQQVSARENIWRLNLKDEKHRQGPPVMLGLKKGRNWRPHFSPDGKRFVFESNGLGYSEIYACDSDGSNCDQLTFLHGTAGAPRWSPDGHYIAFEFRPKDRTEIYLLEIDGGKPRLLPTLPGADNGGPSWSRDGKWIYFYSDWGGEPFQLWKVPVQGGSPVQITRNGGVFGAESSDGRYLYFCKTDARGIWKMSLPDGKEERVLDQAGGYGWFNWALAQNGIYFVKHRKGGADFDFFDFATGKTVPISTSDRENFLGLALSVDSRSILYTENESEDSTIMLVKNFR